MSIRYPCPIAPGGFCPDCTSDGPLCDEEIALVMPTIRCGLDRLDCPEVSFLIHKHLGDIQNLTVEVCML